MLHRIYVDNYKCLVNFEYKPGDIQLILGGNGTGKSTVFEVLVMLRALIVDGGTTSTLFPSRSLTRWQKKNLQSFDLSVIGNGGLYRYKLTIEQQPEASRNRVFEEQLFFDECLLYASREGEAQLYRDNGSEGPKVLVDWNRSGLSLLPQRGDNTRANWFKEWMSRLYCIQIDPHRMSQTSTEDEAHPNGYLSNYASWYRHLSQEDPNVVFHLFEYLREIIDGFDAFSLSKEGETARVLKAEIKNESGKSIKYDFDELSEGQRAITGLYTLLALMRETQVTLCIDEPDNFIMLAEIQPWLMELEDRASEHGSQVLVISHHPDLINNLVPTGAVRFFRKHSGPVRVEPFTSHEKGSLPPSEIIARGWENE